MALYNTVTKIQARLHYLIHRIESHKDPTISGRGIIVHLERQNSRCGYYLLLIEPVSVLAKGASASASINAGSVENPGRKCWIPVVTSPGYSLRIPVLIIIRRVRTTMIGQNRQTVAYQFFQ